MKTKILFGVLAVLLIFETIIAIGNGWPGFNRKIRTFLGTISII